MMMKRRQQSPPKRQEHVLPQLIKDEEDDKIHRKSRKRTIISIKQAISQHPSLPALAVLVFVGWLCLVLVTSVATSRFLLRRSLSSRKRPITVLLLDDTIYQDVLPLRLTNHPQHWIQDRRNHYWIYSEPEYHYQDEDYDEDDKCVPLGDWQSDRNIFACNPFHQVDLQEPTMVSVGAGSYRHAWSYEEYNGNTLVFKTLAWKKRLDWDDFRSARQEAMAMAQTSSSNYVANMFGACSHSTIMDYAPDGILWWLFDDFEPTKNELLQIAHDVSAGVADAQNVDSRGRATICHMDIKANQFLLINGTYKLNDFNMCEFLRWDPEENDYCPFEGGYTGRWQAPEQIKHRNVLEDEKSDVFSLGYIIYFLLMGDQQWADDSSREAAKWALHGKRPPIPDEIVKSNHPFDRAAISAIHKCHQQEPRDRPTAREVADFFAQELEKAGLPNGPLQIKQREYNDQEDEAQQDESDEPEDENGSNVQ